MAMELDDVRKWFDAEVYKLERRLESGGYTRAQFDMDVNALRTERDVKMSGLEEAGVEGAGGVKVDMDVDAAGTDGSKNNSRKRPKLPSDDAARLNAAMTPMAYASFIAGMAGMQAPPPQIFHIPPYMPSMVTWWQTTPNNALSAPKQPKKKPRVDPRISHPGKGSRGSDKRVPRQLSFKWEVIEQYLVNQRLKTEGKLDDPCLATARHFGINKSQVSKWYGNKDQIQAKITANNLEKRILVPPPKPLP